MHVPRNRGGELFAEINMIPLIDISLIIMIILMVLTPMLVHQQLAVRLPKATAPDPADTAKTIQVEVRRDGSFAVGGRVFDRAGLKRELILRLKDAAAKRILVQADERTDVAHAVYVLDTAKSLGVGEMGLGVLAER